MFTGGSAKGARCGGAALPGSRRQELRGLHAACESVYQVSLWSKLEVESNPSISVKCVFVHRPTCHCLYVVVKK